MSRKSPPLLRSSLSSLESERPVRCRMAVHLPHQVRLHLRDIENVRSLRMRYHGWEYEVQRSNVPSAGASSQDESSSLPKVSLGISISSHQKQSLVIIIGYHDSVGLSMGGEHELNMY